MNESIYSEQSNSVRFIASPSETQTKQTKQTVDDDIVRERTKRRFAGVPYNGSGHQPQDRVEEFGVTLFDRATGEVLGEELQK
jgi:hypothetical protein